MAIKRDIIEENGTSITRTYSDAGFKIERDGIVYDIADDPTEYAEERTYVETNMIIGLDYDDDGNLIETLEEDDTEEATEDDYIEALSRLGVESDEEINADE